MIKGIIGTVIGDIAGSSHESKPVKTMRFDTVNKNSTVTDDTVLTMCWSPLLYLTYKSA